MFKLFIILDLRLFVSFKMLSPCEIKSKDAKSLSSKNFLRNYNKAKHIDNDHYFVW